MNNVSSMSIKEKQILGYKYDLWCLGLIILQFILKDNSNLDVVSYKKLQKLKLSDLIDEGEYKHYLSNSLKHLLVHPNKRKNSKYIEEKINIDEKFDEY